HEGDGEAANDIDDPDAAGSFREALRNRNAAKDGGLADLGQTDESEAAVEIQAAREAGQFGNRLVAPLAAIDDADASGARFEQPKAILVPARRMRHRQPVHQYLTARYLHEDAAILLVGSPTGGTIGPA